MISEGEAAPALLLVPRWPPLKRLRGGMRKAHRWPKPICS